MVEVEVNNRKVQVEEGWPLIEVCRMAGVEIPRFCYHESLGIAGNCRMCLVEVEGAAKPVASCAMPVMQGMKIQTESMLVKKAREGVMEFLLANHPLDCPICDQGGECDLQDQAMVFGNDRGRFYENKRAVEDKDCGPLVKTVMTRCIHCTRCVRFMSEVAGTHELGTMGRGNSMEIGAYIEKKLTSEISGNVIDLCPVGALTAKPHAFNVRPWELRSIESVDVMDSMGANISVEIRGNEVLRVLPVVNDAINQNWITDKTRFAIDGLKYQRLVTPMRRVDGSLVECSWGEALESVALAVHGNNSKLDVVVGNMVEMESIVVARDLVNSLGGRITTQRNVDGVRGDLDCRKNYVFNTPLERIAEADVCLLVGCNLRLEMPLLGVRLRQAQRDNGLLIYSIGGGDDNIFDVTNIGSSKEVWLDFLEGNHLLCNTIAKAEKPLIIVGVEGMFPGGDSMVGQVFNALKRYPNLVTENWDGRNILNWGASSVGLAELGVGEFLEKDEDSSRVLYLLGADELEVRGNAYETIIYQGHHGDIMAGEADIILPGSAAMEKDGVFVNMEGRWQLNKFVKTPPGEARSDWSILRVVSEYLLENADLLCNSLGEVRERLDVLVPNTLAKVRYASVEVDSGRKLKINKGGFNNFISNFYMTDSISRSSKVMSLCTKELVK